MRRGFLVACALVLLTGCGHERAGSGRASLWITRDRGATVLLVRTVPAGLTAMQALDREADVETRYGGRFVQSIEGIEGDVSKRRDWFWFLNGIEADRSAADYRLHPGDVEWWDFRSWSGTGCASPSSSAPSPSRSCTASTARPGPRSSFATRPGLACAALGRSADCSARPRSGLFPSPAPRDANVFYTVDGKARFAASFRNPSGEAGSPVRFVFAGDAVALASRPDKFRYRYQVP